MSHTVERTTWRSEDGVDALVRRAEQLLGSGRRQVLGIAGAPASGKSTLADALLAELERRHPGIALGVGMDAFHIGHRVLERHGLVGVKGAPHTFDVEGYVALLERIRAGTGTVYAPEFHREIEDSLAHTVEIGPEVALVVTEGNYLLLPTGPWARVRPLLDQAWFVHLDDAERQRRMALRHQRYGASAEETLRRMAGNDEPNARLVNAEQNIPDLWVECVS